MEQRSVAKECAVLLVVKLEIPFYLEDRRGVYVGRKLPAKPSTGAAKRQSTTKRSKRAKDHHLYLYKCTLYHKTGSSVK